MKRFIFTMALMMVMATSLLAAPVFAQDGKLHGSVAFRTDQVYTEHSNNFTETINLLGRIDQWGVYGEWNDNGKSDCEIYIFSLLREIKPNLDLLVGTSTNNKGVDLAHVRFWYRGNLYGVQHFWDAGYYSDTTGKKETFTEISLALKREIAKNVFLKLEGVSDFWINDGDRNIITARPGLEYQFNDSPYSISLYYFHRWNRNELGEAQENGWRALLIYLY